MCMQDIQVGKLTRSIRHNSGGAAPIDLPSNQQRTAVFVSAQFVDVTLLDYLFITFDNDPSPTFFTNAYNPNFALTLQLHGDLPTHAMHIATGGGTVAITATELFLPAEYLNVPLEYFMKDYKQWMNQH